MTAATPHVDEAAIRVLLVMDQPVLTEVIRLALNHGLATTRVAASVDDGTAELGVWRPHIAILDMTSWMGSFWMSSMVPHLVASGFRWSG